MATGLIPTSDGSQIVIRILDAATATNGPPGSYSGAGVDVGAIMDVIYGAKSRPEAGYLHVYNTAGTGTVSAMIKLWAGIIVDGSTGRYSATSPGPAVAAGVANAGAAYDEHAPDVVGRIERLDFSRVSPRKLYAEVVAISGTGTAITVDLVLPATGAGV